MGVSERELWILNFYRNSELHGALLMGRLARAVADEHVLVHATRHCATEAHHAAMLTDTIASVGGRLEPGIETVQQRYSAKGGVPTALVDLLVLSEVLERRVLTTYRAHVARDDVHPDVRVTLARIVQEMEAEDHGQDGSWIEQALERQPADLVAAAERRWREVDQTVVAELEQLVASRFPAMEQHS